MSSTSNQNWHPDTGHSPMTATGPHLLLLCQLYSGAPWFTDAFSIPVGALNPQNMWAELWITTLNSRSRLMPIAFGNTAQKEGVSIGYPPCVCILVTRPMVTVHFMNSCDDTDLVTNLDTIQKRPTEVSPCCYELPRIYWLREKDLNFGL